MYGDLTEQDFITEQKIGKRKAFKAKFDRYAEIDGQKYDRLYSRWVLAQMWPIRFVPANFMYDRRYS